MLLERGAELALIDTLIRDALTGVGRVALVEGSAGVGKTALLAAARERAAGVGMRVLPAGGGELEGEVAFGVVRQLFEAVLSRTSGLEPAALLSGAAGLAAPALLLGQGAGGDPSAVLHGLYWLCANLADRGPVAIVVDDAHWADADSLRWISYLIRRIDALPLLVLLGARPSEELWADSVLAQLVEGCTVQRLPLQPLSEDATVELVRGELGHHADADFCRACHGATGGNPFYLGELLATIRDEGVEPTAANIARVPRLAPATVTRSILLRLARCGNDAMALARAVAVLGPDADLHRAATLAGLDGDEAPLAADRLLASDLLAIRSPLAFAHPIVAASVAGEIEPGAHSVAHKRAARLLDREGAPLDRVALHLMATAPVGDPWVVERLVAAAQWSGQLGAPESAAGFLRRALAEPPDGDRKADVLFELGRVEWLAGGGTAIGHLVEAVESTGDPRRQAERTPELAAALQLVDRPREAVEACDRALAGLRGADRELVLRLEAARCRAAVQDPATVASTQAFRQRFLGAITGKTTAEREMLVQLALFAAAAGTSAEISELMRPVVVDGRLVAEQGGDSIVVFVAVNALTYADLLDEADALLKEALADVRQRGSLTGYVHLSAFRAQALLRRGRLAEAEADLRGAIEAAGLDAPAYVLPGTQALLIEVLVERGDLVAAEAQLDRFRLPEILPTLFPITMLLHSRARLRLAQGRPREAAADALLCGRRQEALRVPSPAIISWRSTAALSHAAVGEMEAARRLADEELKLARAFGAPRSVGVALRVAGRVRPVRSALPLLEEAVATLAASSARLEHARALIDLGTIRRQAGERSQAQEALREGLHLAHRCGATALAQRARAELVIAGARPRRYALRGLDALTASELRIARMAAEGMTNREIAQALFVTTKTVETHLRHAFQKLDVSSRARLAASLDGE